MLCERTSLMNVDAWDSKQCIGGNGISRAQKVILWVTISLLYHTYGDFHSVDGDWLAND